MKEVLLSFVFAIISLLSVSFFDMGPFLTWTNGYS